MNFPVALSSIPDSFRSSRKMLYMALVRTIVPVSGQQKTTRWVLAGLAAD